MAKILLNNVVNFFILLGGYLIHFNKIGFEIIKDSILSYPDNGLVRTVCTIAMGITVIIAMLMIDFFIIYGFYLLVHHIEIIIKTKEIKRDPVIGCVKDKKYIHEHTMYKHTGTRTIVPINCIEKYHVKVKYKGLIKTFNNKDIFDRYNKNDDVPLILVKWIDKKGNVLDRKLELPE